jgi:hypothetical protein
MSLEIAIKTEPGAYIKGPFQANVSDAKSIQTKTGKTMFKAKLTDGQHTASATSFSQTFEHFDGKRVEFSGMGLKRGDDYNGTAQVSIGDKAKWKAVGGQDAATYTASIPEGPISIKGQALTISEPSGLSGNELAASFAALSLATLKAYKDAGMPGICEQAALRAPEWAALWWFGQRSVKTEAEEEKIPF